jgi:hypothetical protein
MSNSKKRNHSCSNSSLLVPPSIKNPANADTGASGNYIATRDMSSLIDVRPAGAESIVVSLPDSTTNVSTHIGLLNFPHLPLAARIAHVVPDFTGSLLSVGTMCDNGMIAVYTDSDVTIREKATNNVVLRGTRDPYTRMYMIDIASTPCGASLPATTPYSAANVIYHSDNASRVSFYHHSMGCPTRSTFLDAISLEYIRFPGIDATMVRRNPPGAIETAQGHLNQTRKNQHSTRERKQSASVVSRIFDLPDAIASDQTGRLSPASTRGMQYIIVFLHIGLGYIHFEPIKNRSSAELLAAHSRANQFWTSFGRKPSHISLDNETSTELEAYLTDDAKMSYQYYPPGQHRANPAERAIQTAKNHFVSILCATDPDFPMSEWDALLPQAELTLNLLRPSRVQPSVSAWAHLRGPYDFVRHPFAPAGIKILSHDKPGSRESWAPHGEVGFYLGPALSHYRCYNVWIQSTRSTRVTDTVEWFPVSVKMPGASPLECLTTAATDLLAAMTSFQKHPTSLMRISGQPQQALTLLSSALRDLNNIFGPHAEDAAEQRVPDRAAEQRVSDSAAEQRVPDSAAAEQRVPDSAAEQRAPDSAAIPRSHANAPTSRRRRVANIGRDVAPQHNGVQTRASTRRDLGPPPGLSRPAANSTASQITSPLHFSASCATHVTLPRLVTRIEDEIDKAVRELDEEGTLAQRQRVNIIVRDHEWSKRMLLSNGAELNRHEHRRFAASVSRFQTVHAAHTAVSLDATGTPITYNTCINGPDKAIWERAHIEEFIRLIETTQTMRFISNSDLPAGRKATYYNPQVRIKHKDSGIEYRVRGTCGGDRVDYPGAVSSQTAAMTTIKLLLNAVVSEDAEWLTADIKDFYLGTPLPRTEYMRISMRHIPILIQKKYNIYKSDAVYQSKGSVLVAIDKGMYGLPQAGLLAQQKLIAHLAKHGYHQAPNTPCLFRHVTRPVAFSLVVDDFGIKYKGKEHGEHLISALREEYTLKTDWVGKTYVGLTIDFDRTARTCTVSMAGYVERALERFHVTKSQSNTNSPAAYTPPRYGKHVQLNTVDTSPELAPDERKRIQEVVGVFLFYARAVDPSMLCTINKIGSQQAKPTADTQTAVERFLQYAATHPNAKIIYHASDMQLIVDSDASHLSETRSRSRAGGFHRLGNYDESISHALHSNGAIEVISSIIPTVTASATESEYAALFINGTTAEGLRTTLADLGYPQRATELICDNQCAVGIGNNTVKQRRSKAIDMRYHWIRDRVKQGNFYITWQRGASNLADYFTKTHPARHHLIQRKIFVHDENITSSHTLKGCVDPHKGTRESPAAVSLSSHQQTSEHANLLFSCSLA